VTTRVLRERAPGAHVHSSRLLPSDHLTTVEGIVTTKVARTLVDLAAVVPPQRVERALDNSLARKLVTVDAVRSTMTTLARKGRPGIATIRLLLAERNDDYIAPESGLEARALELIRDSGLPEPARQVDVGNHACWIGRVDLAYSERRLIIEVDSVLHHSTLSDRRADGRRDRRLRAAGWRIERISEVELCRPGPLTERLKGLLGITAA
jgi:very-short-patch-repair endonuclease